MSGQEGHLTEFSQPTERFFGLPIVAVEEPMGELRSGPLAGHEVEGHQGITAEQHTSLGQKEDHFSGGVPRNMDRLGLSRNLEGLSVLECGDCLDAGAAEDTLAGCVQQHLANVRTPRIGEQPIPGQVQPLADSRGIVLVDEHGDAGLVAESFSKACVVGMSMGEDDRFDILWRFAELLEALQKDSVVAGKPRVDQRQPPLILQQVPIEWPRIEVVNAR